jgi:hypothetical protein
VKVRCSLAKRKVDLNRLCNAVFHSRQILERYRVERKHAVRQYAGAHWSDNAAREKVPINLLSLYIQVVSRNLIAKNPRVMLSTFDRGMKATVSAMETWANKEIQSMRLADTLQRVVLDALFSIGICKTCLATPTDAATEGWNLQAGKPFADRIDLDDFVVDMHARDFSEVQFIGHRYRAPLEVVRESKIYSKRRKELQASSDSPYNREGDERIGRMGRGYHGGDQEEFEDLVDLWEVYVPAHRCVYTLEDDEVAGAIASGAGLSFEPLREQAWLGRDTGPYTMLAYGLVPGNLMPKGPISDLIDLHTFSNNLYRKLIDQAQRQKTITAVSGGADADGNRIIPANDGDMVRVDNPDKIREVRMGGPDQQNLLVFQGAWDLFNRMSGNLEIMGGLGPQSKTATQDSMLNANSSKGIADMQDRTVTFTADVLKSLCWYWYHDPLKVMRSTFSVPGLPEVQTVRSVTPMQRQRGNFEDLDIEVDPYSMQHATPQSRMAGIMQVVQQIVMPMMPVLQQRGVGFDVNVLLEKLAKYMDQPDLAEILTIQDPPTQEPGSVEPTSMKPAQTERTYTRQNVSERTRQGNDMTMAAAMMGSDIGGAEKNGTGK